MVFELFSDECIPNRESRKFYLTAAGIRTRDLRISRTLDAFRRLVLQCVKPAISLAMLYRLSYKVNSELHAILAQARQSLSKGGGGGGGGAHEGSQMSVPV